MAGKAKAWYVLRAISGKEAKVKEVLDAQIRNTDLGKYVFQVLIPTEKVLAVRGGKKVVKEKNLYSGYVFIEAALNSEVMYQLTNTTNVIDFLGKRKGEEYPECLREAEVKRMLGIADQMVDTEADGFNDYIKGETVKVTDGPFSGFTGEIEDIDFEKRKLKVMVKIFGRKTPLELEHSQVERV
ncbi:transcription termination/antitermination protein NusG [uncultured Duncaniella sp.]|uniref:transcription termination/antitermination protein NusG n=1 Tax=uncultured Duncaniella sp. TaxID=2768039 RepID=UPI00265957F7|nr:transcription termination/antitermination protein NusG [uncultured Duncaniella sp.]